MSTHSRSEPKPSAQSDILRVEHLEPPARGKKSSSRHKVFLWRTPVCHDHQVNAERLLMLSGYVELNPGPVLQALQWNAGGLSDWKREKLLGEIHIILLQETQFAEAEVDRFSISQNQPLGFARPTESRGRGGGVSILKRKDIPVRLIRKVNRTVLSMCLFGCRLREILLRSLFQRIRRIRDSTIQRT
ncbi:hypothetical protein, conserved [Angomonas deanei]|uniref:Uncharacterized protein n=1 Tax=Angomonas deanei TaxID=59799 RepID=A0A7G2CD56_9TRYP|nr:hypothetical protein, conserved [Angomonas deanei]CAD2216067.1 hypothetical protein, conserved [Angomonas deanei]